MAKLRQNHTRSGRKTSVSMFRIVVFLIFLVVLLYFLFQIVIGGSITNDSSKIEVQGDGFEMTSDYEDYLPCFEAGEIVHHKHYSLSYNEGAEQANWVAYKLTKKQLDVPNVQRTNRFNPDYNVSSGSAFHKDYTRSGYTRGHLAPAGDMAFSKEAMIESFLMSNISPQLRAFNGGIWKELEELIRTWAYQDQVLYIVTGPLLNRGSEKSIGSNKVKVPKAFYKIILDYTQPELKALAFIIPNKISTQRLSQYVTTIDAIETETGIDFFCDLLSDKQEEKLESHSEISVWQLNENKYQQRVNRWNKQ